MASSYPAPAAAVPVEEVGNRGSSRSSHNTGRRNERETLIAIAATGLSAAFLSWQSCTGRRRSNSQVACCSSSSSSAVPSGGSEVYVWGANIDGQVGVGSGVSVSLPALLSTLPLRPHETVSALSGGARHSACITSEGRVFLWGRGAEGEGGVPSAAEGPREIVLPLQEGDKPILVSCGSDFSLVVTRMGCLYTWGRNTHGQCGRPSSEGPAEQRGGARGSSAPFPLEGIGSRDVFGGRGRSVSSLPPGQVGGQLSGRKVVGASCGDRVCAAVTAEGEVFVWGEARAGGPLGGRSEGGAAAPHGPRLVPLPAEGGAPACAVAVACGESHCVALSASGRVYAWGSNAYGQLGLGGGARTVEGPHLVTALRDHKVTAIACGALHTLCLTEQGSVFVWGYGKDGQCAEPSHLDVPLPLQVAVEGPSGGPLVGPCTHISGGEGHSLAVCSGGRLFVWGRGREGQLGRGGLIESPAASRDVPLEVLLPGGKRVVTAACGGCHTIAATCAPARA
ncbi:ultraviolet-B receptor UVR8 [Cyclospora cayetanensis]|nr:ultraviolet-B receptor UVR8 [Cyclospora cayetanensis]